MRDRNYLKINENSMLVHSNVCPEEEGIKTRNLPVNLGPLWIQTSALKKKGLRREGEARVATGVRFKRLP